MSFPLREGIFKFRLLQGSETHLNKNLLEKLTKALQSQDIHLDLKLRNLNFELKNLLKTYLELRLLIIYENTTVNTKDQVRLNRTEEGRQKKAQNRLAKHQLEDN